MRKLIGVVAFIFNVTAHAQQVDCEKFAVAVESDMKAMSAGLLAAKGDVGEAALASAAASNIQSNLLIMQAAKCKLPNEPISSGYYLQQALDCNMKVKFGSDSDRKNACNRSSWERKK